MFRSTAIFRGLGAMLLLCILSLTLMGAGRTAVTSLINKNVKFRKATGPTITWRRGPITAVIADNSAFGDLHKQGYNGIAYLSHEKRKENLFVPFYSGLNLEHIHDGINMVPRDLLYEPRAVPMELRIVDDRTAELYQAPTPTYKLESCTRFVIENDGIIHMTFECIARANLFKYGYIGLFWASYIHQPESGDIYFLGQEASRTGERWIRGVTSEHSMDSVHVSSNDLRKFEHDPKFTLNLVFNRSKFVYTQPFYYGVSHGMAYVQMFRSGDFIQFTQAVGEVIAAWDFQWFIPEYKVNKLYSFEMRMAYVPFESPEQIRALYEKQKGRWSR